MVEMVDEAAQVGVPGSAELAGSGGDGALVSPPPGSYRLLTSPAEYLKSVDLFKDLYTPVWFRPNGKKPASNSGLRYAAYSVGPFCPRVSPAGRGP